MPADSFNGNPMMQEQGFFRKSFLKGKDQGNYVVQEKETARMSRLFSKPV
jgi:hypothetical protein